MIAVCLAEGFEEIEAVAPVDIMRRAGLDVVTLGVGGTAVRGSHGVVFTADRDIESAVPGSFDGVVLPGGMPGTTNLAASAKVGELLDAAAGEGKLVAAICAAPSVLGERGLLRGRRAVCFPGFESKLLGADVRATATETDGNVITACGAGAALKFGFAIVEYFKGKAVVDRLCRDMQCLR